MNGSPTWTCQLLLLAPKWGRRHSNRLVRIGSALSRSVVSLSRSVEVCRRVEVCRAVELDTLTPRHMQSGGVLSRSVEVCRGLSRSVEVCRVAVELSCRVTVELLSSFLSSCRGQGSRGAYTRVGAYTQAGVRIRGSGCVMHILRRVYTRLRVPTTHRSRPRQLPANFLLSCLF